jgi:ADP-heptose:LPS heptosyltransferase
VLVCQPELKTLLARLPGVAHVAAPQETVVRYDLQAALMEVPRLVRTDLGSIPPAPYLRADDTKRAAWREKLAALPARRKVGLVWAGRPTHENDANRSMRLADFAPLAGLEQVAWVSLQKGAAAEQLKTAPPGLVVHDWTRDLNDFADTAALVSELDLVIAVDTAVCHLAGALGKPVWTLLPTVPDWRWLVDRSDSPWYPSMRLFRQPTPGDWESVMREVRAGLAG